MAQTPAANAYFFVTSIRKRSSAPSNAKSVGSMVTAMAQVPLTTAKNPAQRALPAIGHKFFLLFLFLLAYLALYPYIGDSAARSLVFRTLGAGVTLMSVYAVSFRRGLVWVALILAGPALVAHAIDFRPTIVPASAATIVFSFAFDIFIIVVIFRRVFARDEPTAETLFGAVCIYLLIGFSFARLYAIIAIIQPHAFYLDPTIYPHGVAEVFDFIFYSFGSMTTAGAAGIAAASPQVRSLSMLESILGVLYLAVMISRLMGAYRPNHNSQGPPKENRLPS
jgi:hypothetical protein